MVHNINPMKWAICGNFRIMNLDFLTLNAAIIPAMCVRKFKLNSSLNFQQSKFSRSGIVDDRSTTKAEGKAERRRAEDDEKSEIAKGVSPLHCYADACCCWLLNSRCFTMAHKTNPRSLFTPCEGISAAVGVNKLSSHIHNRSHSYEEIFWIFLHYKITPHRHCCCSGEILNLAEFSTSNFRSFNFATWLLLRFFGVFLTSFLGGQIKKEFIASTVTTTAWQRFSWRIHHQGRKIQKKSKNSRI